MALTYHRARWPKVTPTHQQYSIVARQRTGIGFKLAVHGDSGAGGLVAPLPCTGTSVSWLNCLAVACRSERWPSLFVHVSQPSLT